MQNAPMDSMKKTVGELKKPVKLLVFQTERGCDACPRALELARTVKGLSPKIGLEVYDLVMDRDKTEQYGVTVVPTTIVQGMEGGSVRFSGLVDGLLVTVLLECINGCSVGKVWFPDEIRKTLRLLERVVQIRVFVEADCVQCRPMAETAIGLALESEFVSTEIICADDFPELIKKYKVKTLPLILFGENIRREGHVTEDEFLEMIFKAEGLKQELAKRCLVCGISSADIICLSCKNRIRAEAVDHKTRMEKGLKMP